MRSARNPHPALAAAGLLAPLCAALLLAGCSSSGAAPASSLPLKQVQDLPLPGGATRLDYQSLDPTTGRLYIAHLGDGTVQAVDLTKTAVVGTVQGTSFVHGVMVAPDRHLLLAAASSTGEVALIDTATLSITGRVKAGNTPDGIAYDPAQAKAYVSNEHDHAETVIDLATGQAKAPIEIGGEAGNTVFDPASGKVYVNVQDRDQLLAIDPATDTVTDRIPLDGCEANHGLYVDGAQQLAFVACQDNAKLLVIDLRTRKVAACHDTGDTPDVLAYDQGLHRLYVASESGVVSIFDEKHRTLVPVASAKLAENAHTVAVDQATHRVYFPLQDIDGHPVLRIMEPEP